ncbi:RtcB family protein [Micromonospora cathayae]|uniref:tRNA-splicing ligase RtcB n=1 Tax=Micromonospora cathayae TaxID=3028804 RepID=A0ABY7ZL09_9ACTN|nr:RtcB family protein [Micromonospora sp. HUAS 3]WDZ83208.1 RtcB family protein [Micromonospora sp. HUAS 3]
MELVEETPYRFRIDRRDPMRVPGVVFAARPLLPDLGEDRSLDQVANVATLPGIVDAAYAMPDIHWGYGFPIGGVAATDTAAGGVVSPGGVGFDISCGVRLLAADLDRAEFPRLCGALMDGLDAAIPRGMGRGAVWQLADRAELDAVLRGGSRYAVERGHGVVRDLDRCEDGGAVDDADPTQVSERAVQRGRGQVGSLGSGNHFLEVQAVSEVYDEPVATAFGLRAGQVCLMVHSGSRGLGHQICTDHVRAMEHAMPRYGITVPDRQLACAPVDSAPGRAYLGAMAAAANYARANRQLLAEAARRVFTRVAGCRLDLVYDVSHNLAKIEDHPLDGVDRRLCVHRKGATRAFPPGHPDLPDDLRPVGQPVLIPGSMGTASYVLTGVPGAPAFASTCHGAGRTRSRRQATTTVRGQDLRRDLAARGIAVRGASWRGLAEEMPGAYKDVAAVVDVAEAAGLGRRVARLVPLGVVKG